MQPFSSRSGCVAFAAGLVTLCLMPRFDNTPAWAQPFPSLLLGLVAYPLTWLTFLFAYIFGFLHTLVHEIGHAVVAWFFGMPAIPAIGIQGGGVTPHLTRMPILCLIVFAGLCWLAWGFRDEPFKRNVWIGALALYPVLAFSRAAELLVTAGGIGFEIGGALACFYWVLAAPVKTPLERPLYATWGWWMILYRGGDALSMLRSPEKWENNIVSQGGLSEGLLNDLPRLSQELGIAPPLILGWVLLACIGVLPCALVLSLWRPRHEPILDDTGTF